MPVLLMDGAIQLDCQAQLRTIEVHDEWSYDLLTSKSQPQHPSATKEFPCLPLGSGSLTPESPCLIEQERILVLTGDDTPACRNSGHTRLPRNLPKVAINARNGDTIPPQVSTSNCVGAHLSPLPEGEGGKGGEGLRQRGRGAGGETDTGPPLPEGEDSGRMLE